MWGEAEEFEKESRGGSGSEGALPGSTKSERLFANLRANPDEIRHQTAFFEHYHRWVYAWALKDLGNPTDAEDVAARLFLRLFQAIRADRVRPMNGTLRRWISTVVQHAIVDVVRERRRYAGEGATLAAFESLAAPESIERLDDQLQRADFVERFIKMYQKARGLLNQDSRAGDRVLECFDAVVVGREKAKDVDQRLGLAPGTASKYVNRCRARLLKSMGLDPESEQDQELLTIIAQQ